MPRSEPFSLRLNPALLDRMFCVIAATGNEVTRTGLIERALETYFKILEANPTTLEGYDKSRDKSVTQGEDL